MFCVEVGPCYWGQAAVAMWTTIVLQVCYSNDSSTITKSYNVVHESGSAKPWPLCFARLCERHCYGHYCHYHHGYHHCSYSY